MEFEYNKIINPKTGKSISLLDKSGMKLLKMYINKLKKGGNLENKKDTLKMLLDKVNLPVDLDNYNIEMSDKQIFIEISLQNVSEKNIDLGDLSINIKENVDLYTDITEFELTYEEDITKFTCYSLYVKNDNKFIGFVTDGEFIYKVIELLDNKFLYKLKNDLSDLQEITIGDINEHYKELIKNTILTCCRDFVFFKKSNKASLTEHYEEEVIELYKN